MFEGKKLKCIETDKTNTNMYQFHYKMEMSHMGVTV